MKKKNTKNSNIKCACAEWCPIMKYPRASALVMFVAGYLLACTMCGCKCF